MIDVIDLKKNFGDNEVLKGINMTINKGDIVVVIGPSGSGKSTFLRCLNCMEDPTSGKIIFEGVDIADPKVDINIHRRKMGMVFQHFNLFNNQDRYREHNALTRALRQEGQTQGSGAQYVPQG